MTRSAQIQSAAPLRARVGLVCLALASATVASSAQNGSQPVATPSRPISIPLSGMAPGVGTVTLTQRTTDASAGSAVSIESTVTAQRPYDGSVPIGKPTGDALLLTLDDALKLGLHENLGALAQSAAVQQARGQREVATFPESVQFNFFDARAVRLNQSVFDLVQLRNLHGATQTLQTNIHAARNARDLIVLAVAGSYLQILST